MGRELRWFVSSYSSRTVCRQRAYLVYIQEEFFGGQYDVQVPSTGKGGRSGGKTLIDTFSIGNFEEEMEGGNFA